MKPNSKFRTACYQIKKFPTNNGLWQTSRELLTHIQTYKVANLVPITSLKMQGKCHNLCQEHLMCLMHGELFTSNTKDVAPARSDFSGG